jgi:hypothetical protein
MHRQICLLITHQTQRFDRHRTSDWLFVNGGHHTAAAD